jgi:DNA-binding MarR family transcriptional regulator
MGIEEDIKQSAFQSASQKAVVNIIYTAGWLNANSNKLLKPFDLSIQQYNILRILRGQKSTPISVNSLIDRMLDKNSNASRLVEKLRAKGYVERRTCEYDRRQVDVVITKEGLNFLASIDKDFNKIDGGGSSLSDQEYAQLSDLLDRMRNGS